MKIAEEYEHELKLLLLAKYVFLFASFRDTVLTIFIIRLFCKIAKSDYKLRHVCPSVCEFAWNN